MASKMHIERERLWPFEFKAMAPALPRTSLLLALLNFITLLLSIPILGIAIWLSSRHDQDCFTFLQWPSLTIAIIMFLASLLGLLGTLTRRPLLLWTYLAILFLIVLLLLVFVIFTFVVTAGGDGHPVSGARFREYSPYDFSSWLRHRIDDPGQWERIKRCIRSSLVCPRLDIQYPDASDFYSAKLSGVQSGCCKPPTSCGYKFIIPTSWMNVGFFGEDEDCRRWSNSMNELCYECNSCRAGVMKELQKDWRKVAEVSIVVLVLLIIVYALACRAFMNALAENVFPR